MSGARHFFFQVAPRIFRLHAKVTPNQVRPATESRAMPKLILALPAVNVGLSIQVERPIGFAASLRESGAGYLKRTAMLSANGARRRCASQLQRYG